MNGANANSKDRRRLMLAVIPVLATLLVARLYLTLAHRPAAAARPVIAANAPIANLAPVTIPTSRATDPARWPRLSVDEATAWNPFTPWTTPEAATKGQHQAEPDLEQSKSVSTSDKANRDLLRTSKNLDVKIQALYDNGTSTAAIIDSRIIHPGDVLEEDIKVKHITDEGIVLEQ